MPPDLSADLERSIGVGGSYSDRDQVKLKARDMERCQFRKAIPTTRAIEIANKDGWGFALIGNEVGSYRPHLMPEAAVFRLVMNRPHIDKAYCGVKINTQSAYEWTNYPQAKVWLTEGSQEPCETCLAELERLSRGG